MNGKKYKQKCNYIKKGKQGLDGCDEFYLV